MKIIPLVLLIIISLNSCSQSPDCSGLKTGVFETQTEYVGKVVGERTDSTYIEYVASLGKKTTHTINWKSDCSFVIEYLSGDLPPGPHAKKPISCNIIEVGEGYHVVMSRVVGTNIRQSYKMVESKN